MINITKPQKVAVPMDVTVKWQLITDNVELCMSKKKKNKIYKLP